MKQFSLKATFILFLLITSGTSLFAKPQRAAVDSAIKQETLPAPPKPIGRPSVALILDGGGARGFAHIPVLELLESEHIPVDMVIGTSAGAIVGGLYSAGYSPLEIRDNLYRLSFNAPLKNSMYSPFEQILGSHSAYATPLSVNFGSKGQSFSLGMGNGMLNGQNVYEMLKELTIRIPSDSDFDHYHIPFRAVATNLIDGTVALFSHGDLAEAIRSSMSIPGLFQPFEIDGSYYIDGLALDNEPVDVAVKMGYDIIIVSAFPDGMESNADSFNANPLVAVNQMMNMEQSSRIRHNREFADLIIYPDYAGESLIAYPNAPKIYNAAKRSMESYHDECRALYKKIFPTAQEEPTPSASYDDNPYLVVKNLKVTNADSSDEKYIRRQFEHLPDGTLTESSYLELSQNIYHIGKYKNVITRITGPADDRTLEFIMNPEQKQNGLFLLGGMLDTTIALDSTLAFSLTTDIQWRGLTGYGSVISAKTAVLNGFSMELLMRQPIGQAVFSQLTVDYDNNRHTTQSGWHYYSPSITTLEGAYANLKFGVSLAGTKQVFAADAGIRWLNTIDACKDGVNSMAGDFSAEYTLNTLDFACFPTSGTYVSVKGTGVLPITEHSTVPICDITQVDAEGAIPLGSSFNLKLNGFAGFALSEQLKHLPGYFPIYAFSLADRQFFPQICELAPWGMHKIAAGGALQYIPGSNSSVFGLNIILSASGAVGNVWENYASLSMSALQWYVSLNAGLRIQNSFGALLRIGAGTTRGTVRPFISFDIGNIRL